MWILLFVTVFLIVWDIIVYVKVGSPATISVVILNWSKEYPVLPFAFGVLCGHLFFPIYVTKDRLK